MNYYPGSRGDPQSSNRAGAGSDQTLRHHPSNISDVTVVESTAHPYGSHSGQGQIRGRPSLVSLPSHGSLNVSYNTSYQPPPVPPLPAQNLLPAAQPTQSPYPNVQIAPQYSYGLSQAIPVPTQGYTPGASQSMLPVTGGYPQGAAQAITPVYQGYAQGPVQGLVQGPGQTHASAAQVYYTPGTAQVPPSTTTAAMTGVIATTTAQMQNHGAAQDTPSTRPPQGYSHAPTQSYAGWTTTHTPFTSYSGAGGTYQPVAAATGSPLHPQTQSQSQSQSQPLPMPRTQQRIHSFGRVFSLRRPPQQETIPEERESIDMANLISRAAPIAKSPPYIQVSTHDPDGDLDADMGTVDMSTLSGDAPWLGLDEAESANSSVNSLQQAQKQEARGQLTGGLGAGFASEATIRESELLAVSSPPVANQRRALSFRRMPTLGRRATVKALGQNEANRRGEVIEVILEAPPGTNGDGGGAAVAGFDLSEMGRPDNDKGFSDEGMRRSTFPRKDPVKQIFYPQPNWKPFSMRGPYLLLLIILSVGLGTAQEVFFQISTRQPLLVFKSPTEIPAGLYFALKFAPTLISVTYGVLWQLTDFEVRRLEAFYQLSKDGGALAADSINVDYITYFSFFRPFRALYCKHYAVFTSSVASLLAISVVPTLGAASIVLSPDRKTRLDHPLGEKTISISPVWSRFLTSVLFLIAALGCILFWQLQTRRTGLKSDVKGIAGLASMAVVSHILMDFKDMDVATHRDIHRRLKHHRYALQNCSLAPEDDAKAGAGTTKRAAQDREEEERYLRSGLSQNPHPFMLRATGVGLLIGGILLFFTLLQLVLFTELTALTDKAPWVVTALAVCIKMSWSGLETDLKMMEPYHILWKRHAPARTLTLDYTALPFAWAAIRGAANGHFLVFFVGFGTVLSEMLTVLVTSLATVSGRDFMDQIARQEALGADGGGSGGTINAGQETEFSFWITLGLASFILLYMAAAATAVLILRRRPFLPRQPNTIASVLAFIHQSKMLYDFVGTSKHNSAAMTKRLEEVVGKQYGLGWFEGRDGLSHCGVDQEELLSDYRPGYDYAMATRPWETREWM